MTMRFPRMQRRNTAGNASERPTSNWGGWDSAVENTETAAAHAGKRTEPAAGSHLALFLSSAAFDYALVLVLTTALTYTVSYAFNSAPDLRSNVVLIAVATAALLAALFAGSWSKRALAPSAAAYAVVSAVILGLLGATEPAGTAFFANGQVNDVAENHIVFGLVMIAMPLITYLLSRRTIGMTVLFLLAVLACGLIQFFYRDWTAAQPGIAASFVVYASCGACFIYQRYRQSVYRAKRAGRTAFGGAFAFSLICAGICLAAAAAVFFGIIAGLGLTTPEFKPFQDYYQRPVVEYTGTYQRQQVDDPDLKTNQTNDNENDTKKNGEGGSKQDNQKQSGADASQQQDSSQQQNSFDSNDWNQRFQNIGYDLTDWRNLIIIAVVIAAIIAAVILRYTQRERRLRRIAEKPTSEQVIWIYDFLLTRFARLGIEKPASLTPMEFALASAHQLEPYADAATQTDLLQVTLGYLRAAYGNDAATEDDLQRIKRYYRTFYKRVGHQVGRMRWLWKFWRI